MSITVSIPSDVADEIYWYLLESLEAGSRGSEKAKAWLMREYLPKLRTEVWAQLTKYCTCEPRLVSPGANCPKCGKPG